MTDQGPSCPLPPDRRALVEGHLALAAHLARRFTPRGESFEDLFQVACLALVRAAKRYDPTRGTAFSTFATRTVLGELQRHFRDQVWSVRVPRPLKELLIEARQLEAELAQRHGRRPTVPELAEALGVHPDDLLQAQEASHAYRAQPLPGPAEQEATGRTGAADRLVDPRAEDPLHCAELRAGLVPALAELPPRDRVVLELRFRQGLSQSEIARDLGVSQMQVSRILARSLARLRALLTEAGSPEGPAPPV
jgi:RNA polymerase sigma-B factor